MERVREIYISDVTKATYILIHEEDEAMIVRRDEYVFVQVKSYNTSFYKLYLFKDDKLLLKNLMHSFGLTREQMEYDLEFCIKRYEQDMEEIQRIIEQDEKEEKEEKEEMEKNKRNGVMIDKHHGITIKIPPKK